MFHLLCRHTKKLKTPSGMKEYKTNIQVLKCLGKWVTTNKKKSF